MEEYVRKELEDICRDILNNDQSADLEEQLASVQELYEKLVVLNYVSSRRAKPLSTPKVETTQPTPEPISQPSKPEPTPVRESVQQTIPAAPQAPAHKPQPINESPVIEEELTDDKTPEQQLEEVLAKASEPAPKNASINERYGTGAIKLGLNDRLAFTNHLFAGQQEDLNRVISQINTLESFQQAEEFIEQMVKPDYDWSQKEEFELRFMERVKQRFGE